MEGGNFLSAREETDLEKDVVRSLVKRGVGVGVSPPLIAVSLGAGRSWHGDRVVSEGSV